MTDADEQLERIRAQFGKQAEVYAHMRQTTDERSLNALVQVCGADVGARVLDVACGPGFLTMAFAARCRSDCATLDSPRVKRNPSAGPKTGSAGRRVLDPRAWAGPGSRCRAQSRRRPRDVCGGFGSRSPASQSGKTPWANKEFP